MKTALYIEEGLAQVVLTPQSNEEQRILKMLHDGSKVIQIHEGGFYECQGGWMRHGEEKYGSTMIVMRDSPPPPGVPDQMP